MKTALRRLRFLPSALLAAGLALGAGCDWDDDDNEDYQPPSGSGALRVDNNTGDDIRIYVDGDEKGTVGDYSDRVYDLEPGVYRVVLDQKNGDRDYRDEVDIVEGRLTVLDVSYDNDPFDDDYDVEIFFD